MVGAFGNDKLTATNFRKEELSCGCCTRHHTITAYAQCCFALRLNLCGCVQPGGSSDEEHVKNGIQQGWLVVADGNSKGTTGADVTPDTYRIWRWGVVTWFKFSLLLPTAWKTATWGKRRKEAIQKCLSDGPFLYRWPWGSRARGGGTLSKLYPFHSVLFVAC